MLRIVDTPEPTTVTMTRYTTNVTTLTERLAIRFAADGAEHPVSAAVAVALRGMHDMDRGEFAALLSVPLSELKAIEVGAVPFIDMPAPLSALMLRHGLEPLSLVDLEHQLRGRDLAADDSQHGS